MRAMNEMSIPGPGKYAAILIPEMDTYANSYTFCIGATYASGIDAIRQLYSNGGCPLQPLYTKSDGSRIVRPLTFKETMQAIVEDYNTLNNTDGSRKTDYERGIFFNESAMDTCSAIAYKRESDKFKIIPQSSYLIGINPTFNEGMMQIDYDNIDGIELDRSEGKYNTYKLEKMETIFHPAWLAAVEFDNALLFEYVNIAYSISENREFKYRIHQMACKALHRIEYPIHGLEFGLRYKNTINTDEFWALSLGSMNYFVSASIALLNDFTSFLQVTSKSLGVCK